MKKSKRILIASITALSLVLILLGFLFSGNDVYRSHSSFRQSFGILTYETLRHKSSDKDEELMKPIIDKVEEAIAYSGSAESSPILQPYSKLCRFVDTYKYIRVDYNIQFITVKKFLNTGYLWIEYMAKRYDENDRLVNGSSNTLCLINLKKEQGVWSATDIVIEP